MKSNNVWFNGEAGRHLIEHTSFHRMRNSVIRKIKTHFLLHEKLQKQINERFCETWVFCDLRGRTKVNVMEQKFTT